MNVIKKLEIILALVFMSAIEEINVASVLNIIFQWTNYQDLFLLRMRIIILIERFLYLPSYLIKMLIQFTIKKIIILKNKNLIMEGLKFR